MAWQIRPPQVAITMLIGGDVVYKDMLRVGFGMQKPPNSILLLETKKADIALSRNIVTAQALRDKCEWIFFLDSDVIPPLDVLPRLILHNLPLVSGLYWRRYEGLEPCIYRLKDGIPVPYKNDDAQFTATLVEIEACGAGCLLIHSSVFEKLKSTVEHFIIQDTSSKENLECWKFWEYLVHTNVNLSEDIVLASRVRGMGFRIFADLSLRCGHLINAMVKEGSMQQTPLTTGKEI